MFCMQFLNLTKDDLVFPKEQTVDYPVYRDYVYSFIKIAKYTDDDGKTMIVLAIKLINSKSAVRARSMQRSFVARQLVDFNIDAALVAFYSDDETSWRLSFVGLEYEFSKEGLKKKLTPARRYSYLVGKNEPNHTAREQLKSIYLNDKNNPSIKDIEEAFKIEKVTKMFFDEYEDKYLKLKKFLDYNDNFKYESERFGFTSEEFSKKLMGQLVFLYFIQKKGWLGVKAVPHEIKYSEYVKIHDRQNETVRNVLSKVFSRDNANMKLSYNAIKNLSDINGDYLAGVFTNYIDQNDAEWGQWGSGNKEFIRELFIKCMEAKTEKNFFNDYLEPLFYSALNTKRGANEYFKLFNCKIPFLNGGLFESIYGYQDNKINITIPNEMFSNGNKDDESDSGILDIFDTYNFTMNEDEPLEKEVAIDPEMLGKLFENLLDIKDRKSKGAFYTPREIVHYMCQESLINYLHNETCIGKKDIETFVKLGDFIVDEDSRKMIGTKDKNKYEIPTSIYDNISIMDKALKNVRVADPAVGSGAFPLGMLNEIVRIRSYLTLYMTQYLNKDDKLELERSRSNYTLKEQVMKYVIHAVDIERSAVDITKLRLWLSLIVDADTHTVNALPNLDSNIKCGNSLIDEFEGIKLVDVSLFETNDNNSNSTQMVIKDAEEKKLLDKLEKLQKELFDAKEPEKKKEIYELIDETEWKFIECKLKKGSNEDKIENFELLKKEKIKPYFLWEMEFSNVFREKGGFDIVIGNPPYIGEKGHKEVFEAINKSKFGARFHQGKIDLFYYFFHKAIDLCKVNGIIAFITTNYYITATGGTNLRGDFKKRTIIKKLINFNELKIFESAKGQHNMITILEKSVDAEENAENYITSKKGFLSSEILRKILLGKDKDTKFYSVKQKNLYEENEYYIRLEGVQDTEIVENSLHSILGKILQNGEKLGEICNVNVGARTGSDKVTDKHIRDLPTEKYNKNEGIFVLTPDEKNRIKDKNNDLLKPWFKNSDIKQYWTDTINNLYVIYSTAKIDINKYIEVKNHLYKYRTILGNRNTDYPWWCLVRPRKQQIFESEKIVAPQRSRYNCFGYNNQPWYTSSDVYFITKKQNGNYNLKYILALLNSKLFFVWLYFKGKKKGEMLELYQKPLSEIPIKKGNIELESRAIGLVDIILEITGGNDYLSGDNNEIFKHYKNEIDKVVYKIYSLTSEEISMVEEINSNSRED